MNTQGIDSDRTHEMRAQCERCRDQLEELSRIHLAIDAPTRKFQEDEPDWIGRLRKICLHVRAISGWEFEPGVEHVMASEIRSAYEQMAVVWKHLPSSVRLDEMDDHWWNDEARNRVLATFDHPTPQSLMLPAERGGIRSDESELSYIQLAVWLGNLGLGYGLALVHLSQILEAEGDITSRVAEAFHMFSEEAY